MTTIGVDVGGTRTRVAAVDLTGRIVSLRTLDINAESVSGKVDALPSRDRGGAVDAVETGPLPYGRGSERRGSERTLHTRSENGGHALLAGILSRVTEVREEVRRSCGCDMAAMGLALPATLDEKRCCVVRCVNVPALEGRAVADEVRRANGLACTLMTDMEAATWAEYLQCGSRPRRFLHLRIGTGVGVGLVNNGRPQRLDADRTTHLSALVVEHGPEARGCRCGLCGCLETYCSGAALLEEIRAASVGTGMDDLRVACKRGDEAAVAILASAADALAKGLKNLTTSFHPDVINVGGGVIARFPALIEQACLTQDRWAVPTLQQDCWTTPPRRPTFEPARLGDEAGVIGAALLAQ